MRSMNIYTRLTTLLFLFFSLIYSNFLIAMVDLKVKDDTKNIFYTLCIATKSKDEMLENKNISRKFKLGAWVCQGKGEEYVKRKV